MRREWRWNKALKKDASLCSVPQLRKSGINVIYHWIYDKSHMEREIQITKSCLCLCRFFVSPSPFPRGQEPVSSRRSSGSLSRAGDALPLRQQEPAVQALLLRRLLRQCQQFQEHGGVPGQVSEPRWGPVELLFFFSPVKSDSQAALFKATN